MNAHANIKATPVDRMDELVAILTQNIAVWYFADESGDDYLEKRNADRRETLEKESSWLPCKSPAGALAKLCMMEADISAALTFIDDENTRMRAEGLLTRQVGTLIRWVENEFSIKREDYRLNYYHTDHCERRFWALKNDGEGEIPS
jgi:hypothetical protein